MARRNTLGLICELKAQEHFAKQKDLIVFTPLGGLGPVDIITLNKETGEFQAYDVKAVSKRKTTRTSVDKHGWKRTIKSGVRINRTTSTLQKKLKVKLFYVD